MQEITYLFFTILIEAPIALFLLRQEKWQRVLLAAAGVSIVSHPIAWQLVLRGGNWWVVEGLVALFEGSVFALLFPRARYRAGLAAVAMNVASAFIGLLI